MTKFKILEFKKSQYSYEAIENALSQKASEGWKVISMHTDVSTDLKGIVVVLLQQVTPEEGKTITYTDEDVENKRREIEIRRMEAETRAYESADQEALNVYRTRNISDSIRTAGSYESGSGNAGSGIGMLGVAAMTMANNGVMGAAMGAAGDSAAAEGWTCFCGQTGNQGKYCMNCAQAKPISSVMRSCVKCGWKNADGQAVPKFCPECGRVM